MRIELFGVDDRTRMEEALKVRFAVFVEEQHVPTEIEIDEHDRDDRDAVHAIVRDGERVVAAGRFYRLPDGGAQIGRMAVAAADRGRGIGGQLLTALVAEARRRNVRRVTLDAQDHAVGFYLQHGFTPFGATHLDAGIVHQPMEQMLTEG